MNIKALSFSLILSLLLPFHAAATGNEPIKATVAEAWTRAKAHHALLKAKGKEVESARALLRQERLFENPEVAVSHNVNNPVTHRYFETNREGQTDIQLSQRIYIAGQRGQRIRKADAELRRTEADHDDATRLLRRDLSQQMVELAGAREKQAVVEREIASAQTILRAFEAQQQKGNVAAAEVMRLRSQYVQLLRERGEVEASLTALQQSIALMLGTDAAVGIIPQVDYEATVASLSEIELHDLVGDLSNRPDMQSFRHDMASAAHDIKLQKANAWPTVSLTGEWDKNGSIGRNFFAVGLTMTLPLFNQNQGNIRAARATLEAKQMEYEWQRNQAASKLDQDWKQLQSSLRIADEAARHLSAANEGLMQQMERMYLARNISLLELIDYYQAYKDNHFLLIDSRGKVLSLMAEMDLEIK